MITVEDTGRGLADAPRGPAGGVGLTNVRERLAALYGTQGQFGLASVAPSGTRATLRIPFAADVVGVTPVALPIAPRAVPAIEPAPHAAALTTPMPTAVIAEDESLLRAQLKARVAEASPELEVVAEAANGDDAERLVDLHRPDVVFLDIRMPVRSGIDVARAIAGRCHVVFVTAYDEYAVAAFEEGAVDYVLKPVTAERVAKVVARLKARIAQAPLDIGALLARLAERETGGPLKWIRASLGAAMKLIPTEDVLYFQAEDKYTKVVTADSDALIRKSIRELYEELDPDGFWQIHRGTIVQSPRNRPCRARRARPAGDPAQGTAREALHLAYLRLALQSDVTPPRPQIAGAAASRRAAHIRGRMMPAAKSLGRPGAFRAERARSAPIAAAARLAR